MFVSGNTLVISKSFPRGIAIHPSFPFFILQFKLIEISKSVVLIFNFSFLYVNNALPIIGSVVLDGIAFDNNCSFVKKIFLSIENFIFYPIW